MKEQSMLRQKRSIIQPQPIQNLFVKDRNLKLMLISREAFNYINQNEQKITQSPMINIQTMINEANMPKQFIKNNRAEPYLEKAKNLFNQAKELLLLKTGQYYIQKEKDTKRCLLFNQNSFTYLQASKNQIIYRGVKYVTKKSIYLGQFLVFKSVMYHGNGKLLLYCGKSPDKSKIRAKSYSEETSTSNQGLKFVRFSGMWDNGQLHKGVKRIFKNEEAKQIQQQYEGEFLNFKYHGKGQLKKQQQRFSGYFQNDRFIEEIKKQVVENRE